MDTVTVVFEVTDRKKFIDAGNPLHITPPGLKPIGVGMYDGMAAWRALRDLLPFAQEDYYPNCATPEFKAAMEAAEKAAEIPS